MRIFSQRTRGLPNPPTSPNHLRACIFDNFKTGRNRADMTEKSSKNVGKTSCEFLHRFPRVFKVMDIICASYGKSNVKHVVKVTWILCHFIHEFSFAFQTNCNYAGGITNMQRNRGKSLAMNISAFNPHVLISLGSVYRTYSESL